MKSTSDGPEMARGVLINALTLVASNLRAVFTFLIARLLGGPQLGTFVMAWSTTDLVSKVGNFGFDNTGAALVSQHMALQDRAGARQISRLLLRWGLLISSITAIACIAGLRWSGAVLGQSPELLHATSWMLLALPGICLYRVGIGLSRGMGQMQHDIYSRGLAEPIVTILAFLFSLFVFKTPLAPVIGALAGTLAGGLVAILCALPLFPPLPDPVPGVSSERILRFSAPIALTNLLNTLTMRMDVLLLGLCVGHVPGATLETLGVFSVAVDLAAGMRKVRQAFDPIFMPIVARHMALDDQQAAMDSFGQMGRWILAIQFLLVGALGFGGEAVLALYGQGFRQGAPWIAILTLAHLTNSFVGLGESVLLVQRPILNLINSVITVLVQAAASIPLIYWLGPAGGALGMVIAYATQGVLRAYELSRFYGWAMPWPAFSRPIAAFLAGGGAALALRWWIGGLLGSVASGACFLAVYALAWLLFGLDEADRKTLQSLRSAKP